MAADRSPPKNTQPGNFVPGSRATAPMGLEETSESAWQRFQDMLDAQNNPFEATQPATRPGPAPAKGFEPTQPMDVTRPRPAPAPAAKAVTLDEVMVVARRNNRACPNPAAWAALHKLLPPRVSDGRSFTAPAPVDGAAWNATSAMQKRLRLRDQIEWADRLGALQPVFEFLAALPEEQWHHFD